MSLEIEKRFKNFKYTEIKKKLLENNFEKFGGFLFKIITYKGLDKNQKIRVRDEGYRTVFTIKNVDTNNYDVEYEVIIDSYDMMNQMLIQLKLEKNFELHKFREIYRSKNGKTEVIFDNFPGLPPYMEVESKTEKDLQKTMKILGLSEEPKFTASDLYLEHYGITKNRPDFPLTFANADEYLTKYITKSKKEFMDLLKKQHKKYNKKSKK